jgi:hypothetical protein
MLPSCFDQEEFERDLALYQALYPISAALSKLNELVEGTLMAVGSDAYTTALDVYAFSKLTDGVTGLEDLRTSLSGRFRNNGSHRPADA